ncbi:MAG: branched chain amino acid aminotransferase, partial [Bacteroidetes bacterium]|nr:branched chain amino acid aminotransferase [Bacteroidota bacterium]
IDGNILQGVTRDSCIKLLREGGYDVVEKKISLKEIADAFNEGLLTDAFGTGTAALIAKIESIYNEGENYILPNAEDRKVSNWLYKKLSDVQTSKIIDTHNWVYQLV